MHRILLYLICLALFSACNHTKQAKLSHDRSVPYPFSDSLSNLLHQIKSIPVRFHSGNNTCGDSIYWKVVRSGKNAVPLLISQLGDSSETQVLLSCYSGRLKIHHLAFILLEEICPFPIAAETGMQFDVIDEGCPFGLGFLEYVDRSPANFQGIVSKWYGRNSQLFRWQFASNNCGVRNGVKGFWAKSLLMH
jgi:hypothetical protein